MTHPRPTAFLPGVQAASVCTVTTSGGTRTRGLSHVGDGGLSVDLLRLHSLAILIAKDRVSSGDAEKPSKRNMFLAFHKLHMTHRNKAPNVIPAGDKFIRSPSWFYAHDSLFIIRDTKLDFVAVPFRGACDHEFCYQQINIFLSGRTKRSLVSSQGSCQTLIDCPSPTTHPKFFANSSLPNKILLHPCDIAVAPVAVRILPSGSEIASKTRLPPC
ncbi:hypothetical protein DY000_02052089 [Brassica cretica]|uniref:Uncharacterized protein n=1 Tax=Brassica cretica TaxID=69181 RepID=A0ABQ7A8B1_BRACR|nr:hypothetical protein DY000_02052089 [Brassica cretica]